MARVNDFLNLSIEFCHYTGQLQEKGQSPKCPDLHGAGRHQPGILIRIKPGLDKSVILIVVLQEPVELNRPKRNPFVLLQARQIKTFLIHQRIYPEQLYGQLFH